MLIFLKFFLFIFFLENLYNSEEATKQQNTNKVETWSDFANQKKSPITRFNWYERNEIRKKVYYLYTDLVALIESVSNVLESFKNKYKEINILIETFNKNFSNILISVNNNFNSVDNIINNINESINKLKEIEKDPLFEKNKNLKKEVAILSNKLEDLIILTNQQKMNFDLINKSKDYLNNSIILLSNELIKMNDFEKQSWDEYQKLDELIKDEIAKKILLNIKNNFKNTEKIFEYVRKEFLNFFNLTVDNITNGIRKMNTDLNEWANSFKECEENLNNLIKYLNDQKEADKKKEEDEQRRKIEEKRIKLEIEERKRLENLKKSTFENLKFFINNYISLITSFIKNIFGINNKNDKNNNIKINKNKKHLPPNDNLINIEKTNHQNIDTSLTDVNIENIKINNNLDLKEIDEKIENKKSLNNNIKNLKVENVSNKIKIKEENTNQNTPTEQPQQSEQSTEGEKSLIFTTTINQNPEEQTKEEIKNENTPEPFEQKPSSAKEKNSSDSSPEDNSSSILEKLKENEYK